MLTALPQTPSLDLRGSSKGRERKRERTEEWGGESREGRVGEVRREEGKKMEWRWEKMGMENIQFP